MEKKIKTKRGLSLIMNIGSYGGFYTHKGKGSFRFCLGWIAFTWFMYDLDDALKRLL